MVIDSKVYYGGGDSDGGDDDIVRYHDPSQGNWISLPPLPVKWLALVSVKLLANWWPLEERGRVIIMTLIRCTLMMSDQRSGSRQFHQ